MKMKTIVIGSLLAVFVLLMIPQMSAIEQNAVENTIESKLNLLQEKMKDTQMTMIKPFTMFRLIRYVIAALMTGSMTAFSIIMSIYTFFTSNSLASVIWIFEAIIFGLYTIIHLKNYEEEKNTETINRFTSS